MIALKTKLRIVTISGRMAGSDTETEHEDIKLLVMF